MTRVVAGACVALVLGVVMHTAPARGTGRPVPAMGKPFVRLESREKAAIVAVAKQFFGPRYGGAWVTESSLHIGAVAARRPEEWRLRALVHESAVVVDPTPVTYTALQRRMDAINALLPDDVRAFVFWEPVDEIDVVAPSVDPPTLAHFRALAAPLRVRLIVSTG